jgi:LuxR family transcriptional regulator, maltose regulon positive regulatory protein
LTVAPATPRLIDRGDLLAALDRAAARKVTILSAPAGSGKTSLLRAWADRPGRPHQLAVMQVQRDQYDAQQFWLALLNAVRQASATTRRAEPPAATPEFNGRAMVDRVLSELADARDGITLVIDDLHELHSSEALAQLTRLLTNLPPQVHAIVATRHDMRLRLQQLRLAGELAEIRTADLRFTQRETRELLDASGIALSEAGIALLHQRTEGWAAGLRLAAISLADHPDPERFVTEFSGSNRTVAEYLLAEMLDRQPDDVRQLLLRTSLLDRVNGELGDLLTGRPGSERTLLQLEDANAFVVALDPSARGFATTTCSGISCGWSCAARCPKKCRRCTGVLLRGSPSMARLSRPSGTPRRRVTGLSKAEPGGVPAQVAVLERLLPVEQQLARRFSSRPAGG